MTPHVAAQVTAEATAQVAAFCHEPKPAKAIMAELGLKHWKTFQTNYLAPLMAMGVLERIIPDKPRSRMQRYKTTEAGLAILSQSRGTVMKLCVSPGWALPRAPGNLRALRSLISAKEILEVPQSTGLAPS